MSRSNLRLVHSTPSPLDGALMMAARGFAVIRLKPGSKVPIVGPKEATTDPAIIQGWVLWGDVTECNFGYLLGADHVGLDFDLYKTGGREARAQFGEIPPTLLVFTPGGGEHAVLKITRQVGQQKPAPTIDVRTGVGYLVCPGSIVGGKPYLLGNDTPPAVCPPHIDAKLGKRAEPYDRTAAWEGGTCGDWIAKIPGALWERIRTEGPDRSKHSYRVMSDLFEIGLTDDDVVLVMDEPGAMFATKFAERGDLEEEISRVRREWRASHPSIEFEEVRQPPTAGLTTRLSDLAERPQAFTWYPYLPAGEVSVLAGKGGMGKGLTATDICSRISRGDNYPFSDEPAVKGSVLWCEAEDDFEKTILPRFIAAGGDRGLIETTDPLRFQQMDLGAHVRANNTRLVIFSPVVSFLNGVKDINSELEVRRALEGVRNALAGTDCAVLGLMHLNKKPDLSATDRILGSVVFTNFVRSVLMVVPGDKEANTVRMMHAKHNLSPRGRDLFYTPQGTTPDKTSQRVKILWTMPDSDCDVDSAYDRKRGQENKPSAGQWLVQYLVTNSMVPRDTVIREGEKAGHTEAAIEKVRSRNKRIKSDLSNEFPARAIWWIESAPAGEVS